MDVQCKKCGAEYTLDETLVASSGTSVRCTKCDHVFRVYRSTDNPGDQDEWHIRKETGKTFAIERIGVLQRMIADGRISADDAISRSGGPWKRIGDIPEMQPFFEASRFTQTVPESQKATHRTTMKNLGMPPQQQQQQPSRGEPRNSTTPKPPGSEKGGGFSPRAVAPLVTAKPIETIALGTPAKPLSTAGVAPAAVSSSKRTDPPPGPVPVPVVTAPRPRAPLAVPVERPKTDPVALHAAPGSTPPSVPPNRGRAGPSEMPTSPGFQETGDLDFSQIPATRDEHTWGGSQNGVSSAPAGPAWADRGSALHRLDSVAKPLPARKKKVGRWIVGFFVVGAAVGSFYTFRFHRPLVKELLGDFLTSSDENRFQKFFDRGREAFLLDSETYYRRADQEFRKVLALHGGHAPTLAALAETHAVWAQYLVDAELDALSDASNAPDTEEPEEAQHLAREVQEQITEASRWADQALRADPSLPEAHRVKADVLRLSGKIDEATEHLAAAEKVDDPETAYVSIMLDLDRGAPTAELVRRLDGLLQQQTLIRAMYRKARFLAVEGDLAAAKEEIARILELNSEHDRAKTLLEMIRSKRAVALRLENQPPAAAENQSEEGKQEIERAASPKEADAPSPAEPTGGIEALLKQAARNQSRGRTQNAVKIYNKVLERDPANQAALSGLAYCFLDQGSSGRAIALFRRLLQNNPGYGPALIGLGTTFKAQGQKQLALKYFKQYIDTQPSGPQAALARRNIEDLEAALSKAVAAKSSQNDEDEGQDAQKQSPSDSTAGSQVGDDDKAPIGVELPDASPSETPETEKRESLGPDEDASPPPSEGAAPPSPNESEE